MVERDLDALSLAYERDGFVNGGVVLTPSETAELVEELERYMDGLFRGRGSVPAPGYAGDLGHTPDESHFQIAGLWKVSPPFKKLIENPLIHELAVRLGRTSTLQLWCDTVQYKPPSKGGPFHWHQDAPYHQSIQPAERLLGIWVALDDADEETGCMWMVPGSHRWGFREPHLWRFRENTDFKSFGAGLAPPGEVPQIVEEWRGAEACRVRAGEVHFHHALTWHGSPTNKSNRPRRAYTMFYMPEDVRVSTLHSDARIPIPQGSLMLEAGPEFPIVYRTSELRAHAAI